MQSNVITRLTGIINGTTNYILTRMTREGADYASVLKDAQKLGYAEKDPTADVEGFDAAYKLSILSSLAFHTRVPLEKVYREGIANVSAVDIAHGKDLGYVLKLLAIARTTKTAWKCACILRLSVKITRSRRSATASTPSFCRATASAT